MKSKKLGGVVVLAIGVVLFIFAVYEKSRVNSAKAGISRGTSMFSGNPAGNAGGGYMEGEASKYDTTLMLCQIGGIALIVIGGYMVYKFRKHR